MSPYLVLQEKRKSAEKRVVLGIWLMMLGFGVFIAIAWSESNESLLIWPAVIGFLAGIIGIKTSLNGRDLKKSADRGLDALILANIRYKKMKEDSILPTYRNTIKHLFKKS